MCTGGKTRRRDQEKIHRKQELGAREETEGYLQFLEIWGNTGLPRKEREAQIILLGFQLVWPQNTEEIGHTQTADNLGYRSLKSYRSSLRGWIGLGKREGRRGE